MAARSALLLALAPCLLAAASAQLTTFSQPGAPPFLDGATTITNLNTSETSAVGWYRDGTLISVSPVAAGGFLIETIDYLSWECDPSSNGSYFAIVNVTTMQPGGASSTKEMCEYGSADVLSLYRVDWARAEGSCPTEATHSSSLGETLAQANECGVPEWAFTGTTTATTTTTGTPTDTTTTTDTTTGTPTDTTTTTGTTETDLDGVAPMPSV